MKILRRFHRLPGILRTIIITVTIMVMAVSFIAIPGTVIYLFQFSSRNRYSREIYAFIEAHKKGDIAHIASVCFDKDSDEYNAFIEGADDYFYSSPATYFILCTDVIVETYEDFVGERDILIRLTVPTDGVNKSMYIHYTAYKRNKKWYLDPSTAK